LSELNCERRSGAISNLQMAKKTFAMSGIDLLNVDHLPIVSSRYNINFINLRVWCFGITVNGKLDCCSDDLSPVVVMGNVAINALHLDESLTQCFFVNLCFLLCFSWLQGSMEERE